MDSAEAENAKAPEDGNGTQATPEPTSSPRRRTGCLSGILTGLVSGVLVAFYLTPTGQATLTAIRHHVTKPNCSNTQWLLQVPDNEIFASSYYFQADNIPGYGILHVPDSTIDGDLRTAWLQLWPSPSTHQRDSSDYIEWTFPQKYHIRLICIVDGWTEDSATYVDTLPIGAATIYATDSAKPAPMTGSPARSSQCSSLKQAFRDYLNKSGLEYSYDWQGAPFSCTTDDVVLHIDSVSKSSMAYRKGSLISSQIGADHGALVGLSEVRFYYCPDVLCFLPTH